jgi:hypothetical protein
VAEEVQEQRVAVAVVDDPVAGLGERLGEVDGQCARPGAARPAGVGQRDEDRGGDGQEQQLLEGTALEQREQPKEAV